MAAVRLTSDWCILHRQAMKSIESNPPPTTTAGGGASAAHPSRPRPWYVPALKALGGLPKGKGLLWRVILPMLPPGLRRIVDRPFGFWMSLDLNQLLDFEYTFGIHDSEEVAFLVEAYESGTHFVDVGANQGFYSLYLASRRPDARIIAFEPDPYSLEKLRLNREMNGFGNISIVPCAIADDDATRTLRVVSRRNRGANSLLESGAPDGGAGAAIEVPCRPLLDVLLEHGVERVSALKIDVEGYEYPVLRRFLADAPERLRPRAIVVEALGDRIAVVGGSPVDLLVEHGYRTVNHGRFNFLMKLRGD